MVVTATQRTNPVTTQGPQRDRLLRSAKEFEGMLLETILGPLEKSFSKIDDTDSPVGTETYESLGVQALSRGLAEHGGLGLAERMTQSLCKTSTLPSGKNY